MPYFPPTSLPKLASVKLGAAAQTTGAISIQNSAAYDALMVVASITGYSGNDIASLRFNGDTAANYWDRHLNAAAGGTVLTNTQNVSSTLIRLGATGVTTGRIVTAMIQNAQASAKEVSISVTTGTGAAATAGLFDVGHGEWINTTSVITSITMLTAGGTITMNAGTGFAVYGVKF